MHSQLEFAPCPPRTKVPIKKAPKIEAFRQVNAILSLNGLPRRALNESFSQADKEQANDAGAPMATKVPQRTYRECLPKNIFVVMTVEVQCPNSRRV